MSDIVKEYATDEITIEWRPELCQYSTNCFRSLPAVFNPRVAPWIQPEHAETSELVSVVRQCPSGALRIKGDPEPTHPATSQRRVRSRRGQSHDAPETQASLQVQEPDNVDDSSQVATFEIEHGGPVKVHGHVTLKHADGTEEVKATEFELCRCGRSKTKPYCDHSHEEIPGWDDEP